MKAHIQNNPRCVLLWRFGPDDAGYSALAAAAAAFRLVLRPVTQAELGCKIGDLCAGTAVVAAAIPDNAPDGGQTPLPAMIVSGLSHENGDLSAFISAVKKGGTELPLRAMVTPTSRRWTLAELLNELGREHEAVDASAGPGAGAEQ